MKNKLFRISAVLFDFDGTLTKPGALDFSVIRQTIGCPDDMPVLEFIQSLPSSDKQKEALSLLEQFEINAAANSMPNNGAEEMIFWLRGKGIYVGIISRNSLQCIKLALKNFKKTSISDFDIIISRDDPVKPKPSADGVILAAKKLSVDAEEMLIVGDYVFDIQAGQEAGAVTVFLYNRSVSESLTADSDYTISDMKGLKKIVRLGQPLSAGKLPNDILEEFLDQFACDDSSVLVGPGIGEDTAAVDVDKEEVLVLKSDPITFATDSIGRYAVLINANDIATAGATPKWFLTTLFFPLGTTGFEIRQVVHELHEVCRNYNIILCGGHTEITDAVTRPVITGMLAGTVAKCDLIDKRAMKSGDVVLITKGIAVEGTAIIAREFGDRLKNLGMSETEIETCRQFLSSISIIKEAQIAGGTKGVSAMHDVTEGGLATALEELSIAGNHRIRIDMDVIPVFSQTEKICGLLDINPVGLIGSGSLLICCRKNVCEKLMASIHKAGIGVTLIGEVLEKGRGIETLRQNSLVKWPEFEVDEITRLF